MRLGWLASTLLVLASTTFAGPSVERTIDELPAEVGTDAAITVVSERPGVVHWGVDGWRTPASALRPAGTVVVAGSAVETPLTGPAVDGRYRATLGPFRSGVGAVDLVLRNADGSWTKPRSGRDARVVVRAGVESRRRPITLGTIGRGPSLGRSGRVELFEDLQDWELADCRGCDAADDARGRSDGKDASRDLIALYSRRESDALYLRADLLDLGQGDEQGALDLVVLVDCGPGGQTWLPDFARGKTGTTAWDLAITVRDGSHMTLRLADWRETTGALGASFRGDLDAVELGVSQDALRAAGWDGRTALRLAAYTLKDGDATICDAFGEASLDDGQLDTFTSEAALGGTAKWSVILHGNQAVQPLRWLDDLVESTTTRTPGGNPTGYRRALDAHELLRVPVNIHLSGTLAATAEWGARAFNDRVRGFLDGRPENGEGALVGGVLAEHIMPALENARGGPGEGPNGAAVRLNDELLDKIYGGPRRSVFWIPERVTRGRTFQDVLADGRGRPTGYRFSVIDQVTHLARWYGANDAHGRNGHKINRVNGVSCFVINDGADQWKFANTDGGLWLWTRRELVAKALDHDQEQLTLVFDDWEAFSGRSFTSFGVGNDNPDNYERTLRWIANHPWIQTPTLEELGTWGWREVDRGHRQDLPTETYDWLKHATEGNYETWLLGSSQEESFAAAHPERERGVATPKAYGELDRPGTLLHDVWRAVESAPAGRLKDLAAAIYVVDLFETGWHDEDMNDYLSKTSTGDYAAPDRTHDRISGWARAMHARVGDAAVVAAAARWSASPPQAATTWREDVDHDGEDEYVLADQRSFFVIEDTGARLVLAATRDPATGRADAVIAGLLHATGEESRRDVEVATEGGPVRPHGLVDWWATGQGDRYVNALFRADAITSGWRMTSEDGKVTKTLVIRQGKLEVEYACDASVGQVTVRTGLSPATLDLVMGAPLTTATRADGALVATSGRASIAVLPRAGAALVGNASFGGRGPRAVPFAHSVELQGTGRFAFTLEPQLR